MHILKLRTHFKIFAHRFQKPTSESIQMVLIRPANESMLYQKNLERINLMY